MYLNELTKSNRVTQSGACGVENGKYSRSIESLHSQIFIPFRR